MWGSWCVMGTELQLAGWKRVLLAEMEGGVTAVVVTVATSIVATAEKMTGWDNIYAGYFSCGCDLITRPKQLAKGKRTILSHSLKVYSPSWGGGRQGS